MEAGTLGSQGHCQVIIPHFTENYGQSKDQQDIQVIPYCTLRNFPEDVNHCLEWAKDKFENLFTLNMKLINQVSEFIEKNQGDGKELLLTKLQNEFQPKILNDIQKILKAFIQN